MQLIDMDLPLSLLNYTSSLSNIFSASPPIRLTDADHQHQTGAVICLAQVIILVVFSRSMAVALPFIFAFLYFLQRFYLRTSRQMRLLMIEGKAPLYTHFTEAESTSSAVAGSSASRGVGAGSVTIRAFGWERFYQARAYSLVDQSLRTAYMQSCVQTWLIFVVQTTVGVLAVIIVATVVTWKEELNIKAGGVGVSLIILIGLSQYLASLISSWTMLETRVGAVARVKSFLADTESEPGPDSEVEWARGRGVVEFEDVVASYRYKSSQLRLPWAPELTFHA